MDAERTAPCRCGAAMAVATGEPARISVCHCLACKQRTGSAFSWNATFEEDQVRLEGDTRTFTRTAGEGRWCRDLFCAQCGSTVAYTIEARPGMVTIPAGNFTDPEFGEPSWSWYGERRVPWLRIETEGELTEG